MVTPERSVHFGSEVRKGTVAKLKKLIPFYCVVLACQRVPEADGIMHNFKVSQEVSIFKFPNRGL